MRRDVTRGFGSRKSWSAGGSEQRSMAAQCQLQFSESRALCRVNHMGRCVRLLTAVYRYSGARHCIAGMVRHTKSHTLGRAAGHVTECTQQNRIAGSESRPMLPLVGLASRNVITPVSSECSVQCGAPQLWGPCDVHSCSTSTTPALDRTPAPRH